jgi:hypothetical protein
VLAGDTDERDAIHISLMPWLGKES